MARAKTYYETLGVSPRASAQEIKRAYRELAIRYHPDKTQGDTQAEACFKEVSEAYEILGNARLRILYDRERLVVKSISDLLLRDPNGHRVVSAFLPQAPATPVAGLDQIFVHPVASEILDRGGPLKVRIPQPDGTVAEERLVLSPATRSPSWHERSGLGELGKNGAPRGVLYIVLIAKKGTGHGKRP